MAIHVGSMTRPTKRSATHNEAKPDKENHSDRAIDAALLSSSFKQLIFILG